MGTEIAQVSSGNAGTLLDFMREVARQFNLAYDEANASIHFDGDQSNVAGPRLKANAELVLELPNRLGQFGLNMLTKDERDELFMGAGLAKQALESERPDGSFRDVYLLLTLCRVRTADTLFDRICQRLEAEQAPVLLAKRHVAALDALLLRFDNARLGWAARKTPLIDAGVKLDPRKHAPYAHRVEGALSAALVLLELGVTGEAASNGEFLYNLGFRAKLED